MAQQVALLREQTRLLREQACDQRSKAQCFPLPRQVLDSLDPQLRTVVLKWRQDFTEDIAATLLFIHSFKSSNL